MPSPQRPSLLIRAATLTLAVSTLVGLVVHSSMAAGCNSSGTATAPTATPDPASAPATTSATSVTASASPASPASPSGQTLPGSANPSAAPSAAPADTARPGSLQIIPSDEFIPASKSGIVFRPKEPAPNAAPPPPPPQQNAPPAAQTPAGTR
jgi:hypothetical protein